MVQFRTLTEWQSLQEHHREHVQDNHASGFSKNLLTIGIRFREHADLSRENETYEQISGFKRITYSFTTYEQFSGFKRITHLFVTYEQFSGFKRIAYSFTMYEQFSGFKRIAYSITTYEQFYGFKRIACSFTTYEQFYGFRRVYNVIVRRMLLVAECMLTFCRQNWLGS